MERREYLSKIPPGNIEDTTEIEEPGLCWDEFDGDYGGMKAYKLHDRMEDVLWNPPILGFTIERHGITMMGSSKADLQHWAVDIEKKSISCGTSGYRQVRPRQAPLKVNPIAAEIADKIIKHETDERLKYLKNGQVQVLTGKILEGSAVKETLIGRRKRFRKAMTNLLSTHGWKEIRMFIHL